MTVSFTLNGGRVTSAAAAMARLLDVLRDEFDLTGAKEGCGEGECGACTVLLDGDPVCACLVPLGQVEGRTVLSVEGLARGAELAPVQRALLDGGGIQCGACTPGVALSAQAHLERCAQPTRSSVDEALAGNICRCTGYERITRSVLAAAQCEDRCAKSGPDASPSDAPAGAAIEEDLSAADLSKKILIAGGTDLLAAGPAAWDRFRAGGEVLDLSKMRDLRGIGLVAERVEIGAAVTFAELRRHPLVREHLPMLAQVAGLIGSHQIQNRATIGGNMANASPAGDSLPVLLALGAEVVIGDGENERCVPYAQFHTGYRQTVLTAGELILRLSLPLPGEGQHWFLRKVGTRAAQAISKVLLAACFELRDGIVVGARLAAGSVAATPVLLDQAAAVCIGQRPQEELARRAATQARLEVKPMDDLRSSARYRSHVLGRLVRRGIMSLR